MPYFHEAVSIVHLGVLVNVGRWLRSGAETSLRYRRKIKKEAPNKAVITTVNIFAALTLEGFGLGRCIWFLEATATPDYILLFPKKL